MSNPNRFWGICLYKVEPAYDPNNYLWNSKNVFTSWKNSKFKGLNRKAKSGKGYLCLRETDIQVVLINNIIEELEISNINTFFVYLINFSNDFRYPWNWRLMAHQQRHHSDSNKTLDTRYHRDWSLHCKILNISQL